MPRSSFQQAKPARASSRRLLRVKADFVFPKSWTVIFVDGCFWHGCPRHATKPQSNRAFWQKKLLGNKARDQLVNHTLRNAGWRVLRVWECDLQRATRHARNAAGLVRRIGRRLNP